MGLPLAALDRFANRPIAMSSSSARLLLPGLALTIAGCAWYTPDARITKNSILRPALMAPGSVVIDVFSVRLPHGEADLDRQIWNEVDEQHFPSETRRKLEKDGIRVGVIAGQIPGSLSRLLDLKDKPTTMGEIQQVNIADLMTPSRVSAQHLQARPAQRYEIASSSVIEKMPILVSEGGEIRGVTYEKAQGVFAMRVELEPDGRVQLELTPELQHGESRLNWVGDQSIFRQEMSRKKRPFEELKLTAVLGPGAMLLLGSQPNRPGSLGHYFFLDSNGRDERPDEKLILIRLSQTQHDDLVSPGPLHLKQ
jgi:hypothetical protein